MMYIGFVVLNHKWVSRMTIFFALGIKFLCLISSNERMLLFIGIMYQLVVDTTTSGS